MFNDDVNNRHFEGRLQCSRCSHVNDRGVRCKRQVCIGVPLCWQHLQSDRHLKIKKSGVEGAGKGLFAYEGRGNNNDIVFHNNDKITTYDGERINEHTLINSMGKEQRHMGYMLHAVSMKMVR